MATFPNTLQELTDRISNSSFAQKLTHCACLELLVPEDQFQTENGGHLPEMNDLHAEEPFRKLFICSWSRCYLFLAIVRTSKMQRFNPIAHTAAVGSGLLIGSVCSRRGNCGRRTNEILAEFYAEHLNAALEWVLPTLMAIYRVVLVY